MQETGFTQQLFYSAKDFGLVAVLYGGDSGEREVSLMSGAAVVKSLECAGVDVLALELSGDTFERITTERFDMAFIALHGVGGEDGKVQALLDCKGVCYTGSDHAASALAMNKLHTKLVWLGLGLSTPEYVVLNDDSDWQSLVKRFPEGAFIKPVREGSSLGVSKAQTEIEFKNAYNYARKFDDVVIAEKLVDGPEFSVSIINGQALLPVQVTIDEGFYDYHAKYQSNSTHYTCPAPLSDVQNEELRVTAKRAFVALGCKGWGRIDFMLQKSTGKFYLLEANTVPGMTDHSLVPMAAKASGLSFSDLLLEILAAAKREQHCG
jgi:D-alanine-D-alanine ligase